MPAANTGGTTFSLLVPGSNPGRARECTVAQPGRAANVSPTLSPQAYENAHNGPCVLMRVRAGHSQGLHTKGLHPRGWIYELTVLITITNTADQAQTSDFFCTRIQPICIPPNCHLGRHTFSIPMRLSGGARHAFYWNSTRWIWCG